MDHQAIKSKKKNQNSSDENVRYIKIPYIGGISERIARMLHPHSINLTSKSTTDI